MMKDKVKVIIFDADDTLWDNQTYFDRAEDVFTGELKEYGTAEELAEELYKTESANMPILGYGAKAVCISMMETALRVSDSKVPGENLSRILSSAKSLLRRRPWRMSRPSLWSEWRRNQSSPHPRRRPSRSR